MYIILYNIWKIIFSFLSALLILLCLFLFDILFVLINVMLKFQSVLQFKRQIQINIIPGHLFWFK